MSDQAVSSPAQDITDNRLGRSWNADLLLCWCDDGRIRAARALLTKSPSTVPIRTREFVIADRRACNRWEFPFPFPFALWKFEFLWRAHRNEPGWVVGEHMHVRRGLCFPAGEEDLLRDRLGVVSKEKRTEGGREPTRLTRVGDADRWKNDGRPPNDDDVDDAKEDRRWPEGEIGPLDLLIVDIWEDLISRVWEDFPS